MAFLIVLMMKHQKNKINLNKRVLGGQHTPE